jgi:hypothetical protein
LIVNATQRDPGAELDLYVWTQDGALLASDTGVLLRSSVRFDGRADQPVFIEVRPSGDQPLDYDLSVSRDFCAADTFEENDSFSSATTIPIGLDAPALFSLTACGFDQDWFRLPDIAANGGLRVELRNGSRDLSGVVLTPEGSVYPFRRDDRFDVVRTGFAGDYYIRVVPELGRVSEFDLLVEARSPAICPGANSTSSPETAAPLVEGVPATGTFCPGSATSWEIDWLRLDGPSAGVLDLTLSSSDGAPPFDVALVQIVDGDVSVVRSTPTRDGEARLFAAISPGPNTTYYVRIGSNAAVGRLFAFPTYDVRYSVSGSGSMP